MVGAEQGFAGAGYAVKLESLEVIRWRNKKQQVAPLSSSKDDYELAFCNSRTAVLRFCLKDMSKQKPQNNTKTASWKFCSKKK